MSEITGVRADVVARFKREIQDKKYKIKSEELADKITQKLREEDVLSFTDKARRPKIWTA